MGLYGWLRDREHDREIAETRAAARRIADDAKSAARHMSDRLDALALSNAAMWELLRDRFGLTDADLISKMEEIDLRDGVRDGKIGSAPRAARICPKCQRKTVAPRPDCLYCGADLPS